MIKLTHCTHAPRYDAVLALDRKIRAYVPPKSDDEEPVPDAADPRAMPVSASMRLFARSHYQELSECAAHPVHYIFALCTLVMTC